MNKDREMAGEDRGGDHSEELCFRQGVRWGGAPTPRRDGVEPSPLLPASFGEGRTFDRRRRTPAHKQAGAHTHTRPAPPPPPGNACALLACVFPQKRRTAQKQFEKLPE